MSRSNRKKHAQVEATPQRAVLSAPFGIAAATVCAIVLILIAGIAVLSLPDPGAASRVAGYSILYISAAAGGFFAFRRCRGYAALCGLYTGLGLIALTLLISLFVKIPEGLNGGIAFLLRLPVIAASIGGAFLGTYRPQKRRRHRRRHL